MIRILKAEMTYYAKILFIPIFLMCVWIGIVFILLSSGSPEKETDIRGIMTVACSVTALIYIIEMIDRIKTRRDRFLMKLPVGALAAGIARMSCHVLSWMIVLVSFIIMLFMEINRNG